LPASSSSSVDGAPKLSRDHPVGRRLRQLPAGSTTEGPQIDEYPRALATAFLKDPIVRDHDRHVLATSGDVATWSLTPKFLHFRRSVAGSQRNPLLTLDKDVMSVVERFVPLSPNIPVARNLLREFYSNSGLDGIAGLPETDPRAVRFIQLVALLENVSANCATPEERMVRVAPIGDWIRSTNAGGAVGGAAAEGNVELVQQYLAMDPRPSLNLRQLYSFTDFDYVYATPLMLASCYGHLAVVEALVASGQPVHVDARDHNGRCALSMAVEGRHLGVVRALLDPRLGANVDIPDQQENTALIRAIDYGHNGHYPLEDLEIVQALVAARANVNRPNANGLSALMAAVRRSRLDIVQALEASLGQRME